ncbi:MAG TPA: GNVR domain-containing protein, partial [Anaerolineae bacterium]|nr:GNVR domain-containing protein [Anaerolineae bacterium]
ASVPVQLQIGGVGSLADRTVSEQAALLDALVDALQDKAVEIRQQTAALEPEILALQKAQQEAQVELDRRVRDRDVARETYLTLTNKLDEASVAAQDASGEVRLASQAAVPTDPVSPRKGLNTVLGGLLGLMVGVAAAFVIDARRPAPEKSPAATRPAQAS